MSGYESLDRRLKAGEVIYLDGAIGTELQSMGVPMGTAWAGEALHTHPSTVLLMHMKYLEAGADVLTTNTYASARHNLSRIGLAENTAELNIRAVLLAREAIARTERDRPAWVGGALSNIGLVTAGERRSLKRADRYHLEALTPDQAIANLTEQAKILVDAGVDFLIAEATGSHEHRMWVSEACSAAGVPFWVGFKCHVEDSEVRVGYDSDVPLERALGEVLALGGSAAMVFHSSIEETEAALPLVLEGFDGPVGVYPEAGRLDYTDRSQNESETPDVSPDQYREIARGWVERGVQIVGGCCGMGVEYIRALTGVGLR